MKLFYKSQYKVTRYQIQMNKKNNNKFIKINIKISCHNNKNVIYILFKNKLKINIQVKDLKAIKKL
jgi:hypothetical protein